MVPTNADIFCEDTCAMHLFSACRMQYMIHVLVVYVLWYEHTPIYIKLLHLINFISQHSTSFHFTSSELLALELRCLIVISAFSPSFDIKCLDFNSFRIIRPYFISYRFSSPHLASSYLSSIHFTSFHSISLHFIRFHFISAHSTSFHLTPPHFASYRFTSHHFIFPNSIENWKKYKSTEPSDLKSVGSVNSCVSHCFRNAGMLCVTWMRIHIQSFKIW